ncbi:MAG: hypothetical protein JEZ00_09340, partial [Anaerolineaceae bacterium]|nr:hypothetical protein [Anaerolineaceae bacterium]
MFKHSSMKFKFSQFINVSFRICIVMSMVLSSLALQTNNIFAKQSVISGEQEIEQSKGKTEWLEIANDSQNEEIISYIPPIFKHPEAENEIINNVISSSTNIVELSAKPKTIHNSNIVTSGTINVTSSSGTQISGLSPDKTYTILAWGYYYFGCSSDPCYAGSALGVKFLNYGLTSAPREINLVGDMTLPNRYTRSWEFKPSVTGSINIAVGDSSYGDNSGTMYYWVLENYLADDQSLAPETECYSNASSTQMWAGEPIDVYSGNYTYQSLDIDVLTDQSNELQVLKSYSSARQNQLSIMGYGWSNTNQIHLLFSDDDDGEDGYIILKMGDGSYLRFIDTGSTYYLPVAGISASLQQSTDELSNTIYIMDTDDFKEYIFDEDGILLSISDENWRTLEYTYSSGLISRVYDDSTGRYLDFQYNVDGLLTNVTDNVSRTITYGYDTNSNLISITDVLGHTWLYEYDDLNFPHLLTEIIDPNGNTIERTVFNTAGKAIEQYDGNDDLTLQLVYNVDNTVTITEGNVTKTAYFNDQNQLEGIVYSDGSSDAISYSSQYYPETITDEAGNETQITWYGCNAPSQIIDAEGNTTTLSYDDNDNVISIINARGYETLFEYSDINLPHQITDITDPFENSTSITYDTDGHVTSSTNEKSQATTFTYDSLGQLSSKVDAANNETNFGYNNLGLLVSITNPLGIVTKKEYNNAGWLLNTIENYDISRTQNEESIYNISTTYTYDLAGNVTHITDTYGNMTEYVYDGKNQLIQIILPDNNAINYSYDVLGNLLEEEDQRGNITTYVYDTRNRLVTITDDNGNNNHISYNANDTISSVTDARGYVTLFEYDGVDRIINTTNPLNGVESTTYDEAGNIIEKTDTLGRSTGFEYDALNRLISQTDAAGESTEYFYDEVDNLIQIIDPRGNSTTYTYNDLNQLIKVTDASGHETSFTYDAVGQFIDQTDANGNISTIEYDDLGRQVALIDDLNQFTDLTYDALGQITAYEDVLDREWQYSYDVLGRVNQQIDPMNGETTYTYDAVGKLLTENNVNGHTTTYTYDNLNRISTITDANNNLTSPSYDAIGNIISVTDAAGHITNYSYDALNRQVSITDAQNNQSQMTYDAAGNLVALTDANGISTHYEYDNLDRLLTVIENYISGTTSDEETNVITIYSYDENGNLLTVTDANNHTDTYTYNALNQLSTESDALGNSKTYTYDNVGNLSQVVDGNNAVISYEYDELNRMVKIDYPEPDEDVIFTYDAAGQVDSMSDALGTTNWTYDDLGRPVSITDPYLATVSYAYDAIGNRTGMVYPDGKSISYSYDPVNRLTSVVDWNSAESQYTYTATNYLDRVNLPNGVFSEYEYDAIGRVTSLTHQTNTDILSTYLYSYDNAGNLVELQELFGETIFTDDFESQDLSNWSSYTDDADISVSDDDPIYQDYSLSVSINDSDDLYVTDDSPESESQYNARFYFTPYYLEMSEPDQIDVFSAENDSGLALFGVRLGYNDDKFQIMSYAYDDEETLHESNWTSIGRGVHAIEVGWQAASSDLSNDGLLQIWIDYELVAEIDNLDTDSQNIESVLLGAMNIQGTGIQGDLVFDEFTSSRLGLIGIDTAIELGRKPDFVFSDGFEDGTYDAWTATQSTNITVSDTAAIEDLEGLEITLDNASSVYLSRQTPDEENQLISRFYFNPNSVDITGDSIGIYGLYSTDLQELGLITLSKGTGAYQIQASVMDDSGSTIASEWIQIRDLVHAIELHWTKASSTESHDGILSLWIDGVECANLPDLDNDIAQLDSVRIGAGIGDVIESTSTGSIYFDSYEAHRETAIGYDQELLNPVLSISDAVIWLDASQMYGYDDGDSVSYWEDLSGTGNNGIQTGPDNQPVYSTNEVNGNPALLFDGVSDYLNLDDLFIDADTTIILVAKNETQITGTSSQQRTILAGSQGNPLLTTSRQYSLGYKDSAIAGFNVYLSSSQGIVTNVEANEEYEFHEFRKSNSDAELYRNGELVGENVFSETISLLTGYTLGGDLSSTARRYKGGIAEILVYNRALTNSELDELESYL